MALNGVNMTKTTDKAAESVERVKHTAGYELTLPQTANFQTDPNWKYLLMTKKNI